MKVIRNSVFETNSSSTHSFILNLHGNELYGYCLDDEDENVEEYLGHFKIKDSLLKKSRYKTLIPNKDGTICFEGDDFSCGDDFNIEEVKEKCSLIATYFMLHDDEAVKDLFEKVVKDHTGAKQLTYNIVVQGKLINSYITKQLSKVIPKHIACNEFRLKNFLFTDSYIYVGEVES